MKSEANTPEQYLSELPEDRKEKVSKLRTEVLSNMDPELKESMGYGMLAYVVPLEKYPSGYHCDPSLPLPFMNLANQKNYISFYHMGLYETDLEKWFVEKYTQEVGKKPDMGKCCIRFKSKDEIPFALMGELAGKMSSQEWIDYYEKTFNNKKSEIKKKK